MEKEKKLELRDGEEILWQGKSDPFALMDRGTKGKILAKWIGSVVVAAVILAGYYTRNTDPRPGIAVFALVIMALVIAAPVLEQKKIMGSRYYVTNQRAAMLMSGGETFFVEAADIDAVKIVDDAAEKECVVIHSVLFEEIHKQLRWRTCHPKVEASSGMQGKAMGLVFYNLSDARAAAAALELCGVAMA